MHIALPVAESSYSMLDNTRHRHGDVVDQSQAIADLQGGNSI